MSLTPEELTKRLQSLCGDNLSAVVLYGSAASGDHAGKTSDYNVLVVLNRLGVKELSALSALTLLWTKGGNHAPLLFTGEGLRQSTDVFPIEFCDIKDCRRVLFGSDPFVDLAINPMNLRHELEHNLKGKIIQLRNSFLMTEGRPGKVKELMAQSVSSFLVLLKATLRLYGENPPFLKLEALARLRQRVTFDEAALRQAAALKTDPQGFREDPLVLFERYCGALESVASAVNNWK